jgi:sodium transport system permease protein
VIREILVIARKELVEHAREKRAVFAALLHVLMGPAIVLLISFSMAGKSSSKSGAVLAGMVSIFALVAGFIGGMNVAMDVMAGERERRSLLPLLLNPVSRLRIVIGKWLATSMFSVGGLVVTLIAFAVAAKASTTPNPLFSRAAMLCWGVLGLVPLAMLAAALQLAISTACRTAKEAQTYLSFLLFVPMGIAMFLLFFPQRIGAWAAFVPIAGQQAIAETGIKTAHWPLAQAVTLVLTTACVTIASIAVCGKLLERDDVVYGG